MQPNKPCARAGCPSLAIIGESYCDRHKKADKKQKQIQDKKRESSCKRGYGRAWQKYRLRFLVANPLCVSCKTKGRIVPATVVDHIKPHKGDNVLFWNTTNHQAMCKTCHNKKTAIEDGGFGNVNNT